MNIKSLLLGSAAAATAFTGAQAADAIVIAEPEPMEYVRICDAYGAGYFYIPGTETCLRISGWVRHQIDGAPDRDVSVRYYEADGTPYEFDEILGADTDDVYTGFRLRGNVNLNSRSAAWAPAPVGGTAPGTADNPWVIAPVVDADGGPGPDLTDAVDWDSATGEQRLAYLAARSSAYSARDEGWNKRTGAQINLDARSETEYGTLRGWVQLEGVTGNTFNPADIGIVINRAVIQLGGLWMGYADSLFSSSSNIGGSSLGNYGGFTYADTFGYHYEQRHQIGYQFSGSNGFWGAVSLEHDTNEDYMPDVVGKVAWSQGWGGVWLAAAYDESAEGVGIRGGVQGNFGALTARLDGYWQSDELVSYGRGSRWAVQGTALYQINPQFGLAAGLEYRGDLVYSPAALADAAGLPTAGLPTIDSDGHGWAAQIGMNWQPVQNFQVGADVIYNKEEVSYTDAAGTTYDLDQDYTTFRLRFQRNF